MKTPEELQAYSDVQERRDSLEMLKAPNKWPGGFALDGRKLYVKRRKPKGGFPDTGVIVENKPFTINKFDDSDPNKTAEVNYKDFDEMLNDGWVVD